MELKALTRITGDYGVANKGDVIVVKEEVGKQLIDAKLAVKTTANPDEATHEEIAERKVSGATPAEPVKLDGTEREEANDAPIPAGVVSTASIKEEKPAAARKTKEDKEASKKDSK